MKKILTVLLVLAVAGGAAFAEAFGEWTPIGALGGTTIGAPGDEASAGFWQGQWNNIMSPQWHSGVNFENWTGIASFGMGDAEDRFAFAYATRIGDMYLAAYFGGTGFGFYRNREFTRSYALRPGATSSEEVRIFPFDNLEPVIGNNNRVAILLGVAGMGFRLGYASTASSFSVSDAIIEGLDLELDVAGTPTTVILDDVWVDGARGAFGMRMFELEWGMSRNLLDIGVRPMAAVRLNFARNFMQTDLLNDEINLPGVGDVLMNPGAAPGAVLDTIIAHSKNFVQPDIALASGWVNFFSTDSGWQARANLAYTLSFRLFNNDFTYFDDAGIQTGNISGTAGIDGDDLYERSWMQHVITPTVQLRWFGERVNLGVGLVLPNTIRTESENSRDLDTNNNVVNHYANESSTFTYVFAPVLNVGARWIAIPNRLDVLVGGQFNPGSITRQTVEEVTLDGSGNVPNYATSATTSITFGDARADLRFGATFHFNEHFALDALTGVRAGTSNSVNFFGTGTAMPGSAALGTNSGANLFTFGRIMAVLTF